MKEIGGRVDLPQQSRPTSRPSSLQFPLVQPIQQSGRKLTSLRAGMVLYSNESLIPTNYIIDLPKEDILIQSSGNGKIFTGIITGLDVAVKKTSYRSNEYGIVTLIKHENIVPLLAFVWGEENPACTQIRLSGSYMPDNIYELFTSTFILELEEVVHCAVAQESFPMKTEKVLPKLPECTAGTVSPAISLPPANPPPAGETEDEPSSLLSPPPLLNNCGGYMHSGKENRAFVINTSC